MRSSDLRLQRDDLSQAGHLGRLEESGHAQGVYPEIYFVCPPKTATRRSGKRSWTTTRSRTRCPWSWSRRRSTCPSEACATRSAQRSGIPAGNDLANEELPIKVFDRSGTSTGTSRAESTHRACGRVSSIEIVWLGTNEQALAEAENLKACYKHIFEDILELRWRMAWVTPWFMAQEGRPVCRDVWCGYGGLRGSSTI